MSILNRKRYSTKTSVLRSIEPGLVKFLDKFTKIIGGPTKKVDTTYKKLLELTANFCGASAGILVLLKGLQAPRKIFWGKPIPTRRYENLLEDLLSSKQQILITNHGRQTMILRKISSSNQAPFMALILRSPGLMPNSRTMLHLIGPLFSLFEQNKEFMELLRISHVRLTEISRKNMEIAERNVRISDEFTRHQKRLQSISKGVIRMQEEERSKISRELHDGIGQELTALKMNLDLIAARLSGNVNSETRNSLSIAKRQAEQILEEIRELSRLLRPRMLDDLGLPPTLRWYVRNLARQSGLSLKLTMSGNLNHIDSELKTMIFRIVQEGLNNVVKHSKAKSAMVRLAVDADRVNLAITDSGTGFNTTFPQNVQGGHRGIGLLGMRDRVSLFDGKFNVISRPGTGTTLKIQIPMKIRSSKRNSRG